MIRRLCLSFLVLLFLAVSPLLADNFDQTVQFTNSTNAITNEGFSISPYQGTLNGQPADFFCIDFDHAFGVSQGQTTSWNALATPVAGSSTFIGTLQYSLTGNSTPAAFNNYLEIAWLINQLQTDLNMGDLNAATNDQLAIWTFSGYVNNNPTNEAAINTLLTDASSSLLGNPTYSGWGILTPDYANFPNSQEMIVINTPEPGSLVLLLAGVSAALLLGLLRKF